MKFFQFKNTCLPASRVINQNHLNFLTMKLEKKLRRLLVEAANSEDQSSNNSSDLSPKPKRIIKPPRVKTTYSSKKLTSNVEKTSPLPKAEEVPLLDETKKDSTEGSTPDSTPTSTPDLKEGSTPNFTQNPDPDFESTQNSTQDFEKNFGKNVYVYDFKTNMFVLTAPTGSGKTFSLLENAIERAAKGEIICIAFPNSNLLNENADNLKIKLSDEKYKNTNLDVTILNEKEYGKNTGIKSPKDLLQKLQKGRLIILTVFNYVVQRGEYGYYSSLFMLLQAFRNITSIYVDEAHLLFESFNKTFTIRVLYGNIEGQYRVIKSGKNIAPLINVLPNSGESEQKPEIFISNQTLISNVPPVQLKRTGTFLKGVKNIQVFSNNDDLGFVNQSVFSKSFTSLPKTREFLDKPPGVKSAKFYNAIQDVNNSSLEGISKEFLLTKFNETSNVFLSLKNLKEMEGDDQVLKTNYYDLFRISMTGDLESDNKIKQYLSQIYSKIFEFNCFLFIMSTHDQNFKIEIAECFNYDTEIYDIDQLNLKIAKFTNEFIENTFKSVRTIIDPAQNVNVKNLFKSNLTSLTDSFIEVLTKIQVKPPVEEIYPRNEIEALSMDYILSTNNQVINYKPFFFKEIYDVENKVLIESDIRPLSSFDEYIKIATEIKKQMMQKKLEKLEKKNLDGENVVKTKALKTKVVEEVVETDNQDLNNDDVDRFLDDSFSDDNEELEKLDLNVSLNKRMLNPNTNQEVEVKITKKIIFTSDVPFTTDLNYYFLGNFAKFKKFRTAAFLSATYSLPVSKILQQCVENLAFLEFKSNLESLDRMVFIKSDVDWYGNTKDNWSDAWTNFADFFYKTYVKNIVKEERKYGLFLAPSNLSGKYFFDANVKKSELWCYVVSDKESFKSPKNFTDYEDGQETYVEQTRYKPKPDDIESRIFRIGSGLSTMSVGINLPEHSFVVAAANAFRPLSSLWKYGNIPVIDIRNYEVCLALSQSIGRVARKSLYEKENNLFTGRCVLVSKANTHVNTVEILAQYSTKFYKRVDIIDIKPFEDLLYTNTRSTNLNSSFQTYKNLLKEKKPETLPLFLTISDFNNSLEIRFNLIQELSFCIKDPNIDLIEILKKYLRFIKVYRSIAFGFSILEDFKKEILKRLQNPYLVPKNSGKPKSFFNWTQSSILKKHNIEQRWDGIEKKLAINFNNAFFIEYLILKKNEEVELQKFNNMDSDQILLFLFDKFMEPFLKNQISMLFNESTTLNLENHEKDDLEKLKELKLMQTFKPHESEEFLKDVNDSNKST